MEPTIEVGVYIGWGVDSLSAQAVLSMVRELGFDAGLLSDRELLQNKIFQYYSILVPGGNTREISAGWGDIGREIITDFVARGSGFVGIGAGAATADSSTGHFPGIGLFPGKANYPVTGISASVDTVQTTLTLAGPSHPIGQDAPSLIRTMYAGGPDFFTTNPAVAIVYNYHITNTPAVVAFSYHYGNVVLCGSQLELNADNDCRELLKRMILFALGSLI